MRNLLKMKRLFFACIFILSLLISEKGIAQVSNPTANPSTVCPGDAVLLDAGITGGSGSYTYSWTSAPGSFTSAVVNPTDNPLVTTTYTVSVFDLVDLVSFNGQVVVTVNPGTPAVPADITGTTTQCPGLTGQNYSITAVAGASTYTWAVPGGWSITGGAGTTSITVTTGSAGQNGNITVTAGNSCGTSLPASLAVTVNPGTPATPGTITGTATQCPGLTGQGYSITSVTGASTYTWTVPGGWSITGGAGTNSITVTTGSAGQNGNITVTAGNDCGASSPRSLAVTVNPGTPATPGPITGTAAQCAGLTGQIYSIAAVTGASTYTWAVPTGWSVTGGAGTTSITVTTGSAGQNGNITVTAGNIVEQVHQGA